MGMFLVNLLCQHGIYEHINIIPHILSHYFDKHRRVSYLIIHNLIMHASRIHMFVRGPCTTNTFI